MFSRLLIQGAEKKLEARWRHSWSARQMTSRKSIVSLVELLGLLKQVERETPKDLEVHLVVDNYPTRKRDAVQKWLAGRPRYHVHFTPTSSFLLNLVERFFANLTQDVVREGSFASVPELIHDIELYLAQRNEHPKPYCWKAQGQAILENIQRAKTALARTESQPC
jgi:transposase